jgi:hypothetical protein
MTVLTAQPLLIAAFVFGGGHRLVRAAPNTEQAADYA